MPSDQTFIPDVSDLTAQSKSNHQGRSDVLEMSLDQAKSVQSAIQDSAEMQSILYKYMSGVIDEPELFELCDKENKIFSDAIKAMVIAMNLQGKSVSREIARINLPLSIYTEFYWKIDAHNLMHFLRLRSDSHAQKEIRDYAQVMCYMFKEWVPLTYAAFEEYRLKAVSLGGNAVELITRLLSLADTQIQMADAVETIAHDLNIGKRELSDLKSAFNLGN
jgi:thymidylate synthase (FAD)